MRRRRYGFKWVRHFYWLPFLFLYVMGDFLARRFNSIWPLVIPYVCLAVIPATVGIAIFSESAFVWRWKMRRAANKAMLDSDGISKRWFGRSFWQ